MKKVQVTQWQSADGQNHKTERGCLQYELRQEIAGIMQRGFARGSAVTFDPTQAAGVIAANGGELVAVIQKYQRKFRGLDSRNRNTVSVRLTA